MKSTWSNDTLVCLMLILAAAALASATHTYWYAAGLTALVLAHLVWDFGLPGRPSFFTEMLLIVPFIPWFRYKTHNTFSGFVLGDLLFMAGFYALALGTHHLLCARANASRLQPFTAAIIAMTLAGTSAQPRNLYLPLLVVFLPIMLLEMRRAQGLTIRRPGIAQVIRYGAALGILLVIMTGVQHVVGVELPAFNRWITRKMMERMGGRGEGLSRVTRLGGISDVWRQGRDDQIALRQWSASPALYLRAVAYDRYMYMDGSWRAHIEGREVPSTTQDAGRTFFSLPIGGDSKTVPAGGPVAMVYAEPEFADDFCLPLGTEMMCAFGDRVTVSDVLTVISPQHQAAGGYGYYQAVTDTAAPSAADLQVPSQLRPTLTALARQIVGKTATIARTDSRPKALAATRPAIAAPAPVSKNTRHNAGGRHRLQSADVDLDDSDAADSDNPDEAGAPQDAGGRRKAKPVSVTPDASPSLATLEIGNYFRENFAYQQGVEFSGVKDPILEFLQDTKAGHCEYFASAGVLLLRSLHIPARYVTGFLCEEPGPGNAYRIARRKDAHAWVEMYINGQGWETFDPTPPGDRPPPVQLTATDRLLERLSGWWQRFWSVLIYGGVVAVFSILWAQGVWLFTSIPMAAWVAILVGGAAWTFRGRLLHGRQRDPYRTDSAQARALRLKLRQAEKLLGRHGLTRPPSMPVGAYLLAAQTADVPPPLKEQALVLLRDYQATRFRRHET